MIFRREFLQRSLLAGAGSLVSPALWAGPDAAASSASAFDSASRLPLFRLIHDTRQDASLVHARRLGLRLLGEQAQLEPLLRAVHGDVTRFWYDELQPAWRKELPKELQNERQMQWQRERQRQQRVAVAGTTSHDVLFCLEQLARDHQLRVLWREEQQVTAGVPLVSWLIAAV
jgi:hypothetical protein